MRNSQSSSNFEGYPPDWLYKSNWILYESIVKFLLGYHELDEHIKVKLVLERLTKYKNDLNKIRAGIKTGEETKREELFLQERQKEFEQELKIILPLIKKHHHKLTDTIQRALEERGIRP